MFGVPVGAGGLSRVRFSRTAEALALPRAPLFGFDGPGAAAAGPGHARAAASGVGCLPDAADAAQLAAARAHLRHLNALAPIHETARSAVRLHEILHLQAYTADRARALQPQL